MSSADLPPPYYALKEGTSTEENVRTTEVHIPESYDDTSEVYGVHFMDKDIRIGFIQKILTIKMLQAIAVTTVIVILTMGTPIQRAMSINRDTHIILSVLSSLILVVTFVLLHCCNRLRLVTPYNYVFLVAYPLAIGFFVTVVMFRWGLLVVLVSSINLYFVLFALLIYSVFAMHSKMEFKTNISLFITGGVLIVLYALNVLLIYGINVFGLLYCSLMLFALTAYAVNDLQAMMSKTYRICLAPSDVVKAALIMHIDYRYMIKNLFSKHDGGRCSQSSAENSNCNCRNIEIEAAAVERPTAATSGTDLPPPYSEQNATEDSYDNALEIYEVPFKDRDIRIGFIQKILAIKLMQDIAVTMVMVLFVAAPAVYNAMLFGRYIRIHFTVVSSLILGATLYLLIHCKRSRFATPYNYVFLVGYPLAVGFFVSVVTFKWGLVEVFVSWIHFNLVMFALLMYSIFVMQRKTEFKPKISLYITGGILFVLHAFTVPFICDISVFSVQCSLVMFALTAYALNDLQAMMSKAYHTRLAPSDFVRAALVMHMDYGYLIMKWFDRPHPW